jgi:hypothetical protein
MHSVLGNPDQIPCLDLGNRISVGWDSRSRRQRQESKSDKRAPCSFRVCPCEYRRHAKLVPLLGVRRKSGRPSGCLMLVCALAQGLGTGGRTGCAARRWRTPRATRPFQGLARVLLWTFARPAEGTDLSPRSFRSGRRSSKREKRASLSGSSSGIFPVSRTAAFEEDASRHPFGNRSVAPNRSPQPSGPPSGDSAQYRTPPKKLMGLLPTVTTFEATAFTGTAHSSVSQL